MSKDSRDLADCDPKLRALCEQLIAAFWKRFAPFFIMPVFTQRTRSTQEALWAQGRTDLATVNTLRRAAGLPPITTADNEKQVTWTKNSKHVAVPSRAVDFAVAVDDDGPSGPHKATIDWDDEPRYNAMGALAQELGLVWGGNWGDPGHVELPADGPKVIVT
jgi:hypothetical protein